MLIKNFKKISCLTLCIKNQGAKVIKINEKKEMRNEKNLIFQNNCNLSRYNSQKYNV